MAVRKTNKNYKNLLSVKKAFPKVFYANKCHIAETCAHFDICRSTYNDWYRSDPEFKQSIDDAKSSFVDQAEKVVFTAVLEGDAKTALAVLKALGKDRGYGESRVVELSNKDGKPFQSELSQAQVDAIIRAAHDPRYKHD